MVNSVPWQKLQRYSPNVERRSYLQTLTRVWLGDIDIAAALHSGTLQLEGSTSLRLSFPDWIGLSLFVHVPVSTHAPVVPLRD